MPADWREKVTMPDTLLDSVFRGLLGNAPVYLAERTAVAGRGVVDKVVAVKAFLQISSQDP